MHDSFLAISSAVFIVRHHEGDFIEDLIVGTPLFTLVPQIAGDSLGNLLKAQKSTSGVHQSKQSRLYSLRYSCSPEIHHRGGYNT